jgi:hypothetical protein
VDRKHYVDPNIFVGSLAEILEENARIDLENI